MNAIVSTPAVRHGALAAAVVTALVLLVVFYSVVAGGVQHAAQRRSEALAAAVALRAAPASHALRANYVPSRRVSLARAGD